MTHAFPTRRPSDRLGVGVPRQFHELRGRDVLAEEQARDFGQLVRLVEDHRVRARQQLAHALVAQHDVGEEQVVVDHYRSEEHTSELQSLMRISYAVFCLKKQKKIVHTTELQ